MGNPGWKVTGMAISKANREIFRRFLPSGQGRGVAFGSVMSVFQYQTRVTGAGTLTLLRGPVAPLTRWR